VYRKTKETTVVEREAIICQRENPFYIDTVRAFRDRRYTYKGLHKDWKKKLDAANIGGSLPEIEEAKKMIVLYDSLQLAHKCILNSFYGYVMRKGARWHSMEMAGITCLTGARIIQMARQLVEQIGRPLELDTDGIWCMLPDTFPENFTFKVTSGKPLAFSYPCTMLNHLVHNGFTNHQYHDLIDPDQGTYAVHSENSIFFELDGPYRAMILPSSKEEDKLLKKRYAVFNDDGSLAELKGFEVKRRGELQLIKIFQTQIFEKFLHGSTTEECYAAVAEVADQWLDVLFTHGESLSDEELVDLISENRSMSKTLAEYGSQKSTSISTAKRLAEFLGSQMVKDKGLACKFIISEKPVGAPVTDRAVPVAIFSADESVKRAFLRKWLRDNRLVDFDLRSILDWNYYIERLGSVIQKLITIPAAMQKVSNPVPRIRHPDWLYKRVTALEDKFQQHKVTDFFKKADPAEIEAKRAAAAHVSIDIEDFGRSSSGVDLVAKIATVHQRAADTADAIDPGLLLKNYSLWIKKMKPRWRARREGAQHEPEGTSIFQGVQGRAPRIWDIFQIRTTNTPGRYILWLSLEKEFVPVPLRIPREFYINLKTPASKETFSSEYEVETVVRTLPRGHPCLNLYKISVSEAAYARNESHFFHLTHNPNVHGVFETQVRID
jgi:DNA polymerase epsilon subunit 1